MVHMFSHREGNMHQSIEAAPGERIDLDGCTIHERNQGTKPGSLRRAFAAVEHIFEAVENEAARPIMQKLLWTFASLVAFVYALAAWFLVS
jgi:hypothetical protein